MLNIYFGHDERVEAGTTAFVRSVIAHASQPVGLFPITRKMTADQPEGTNAFTFRRFLVPWIQKWTGWALFVDGADMLFRADPCELMRYADPYKAVLVVKHEYKTRHPRKYVGAAMEADNVDYDMASDTVVFTGNALIDQPGRGNIAGGRIAYNMKSGQVQGSGEGQGRVKMQFVPKNAQGGR